MRLTASALSRAEACIGSCVLPSIPEASDYADTGIAIDRYVQRAKQGDAAALSSVPAELRPYCAALPLEKIPDGCEYQVAFAYNVLTGEVRRIPSRQEGYPEEMPQEWIFGSSDIVGKRPGRGFLVDLKWGTSTIGRDPAEDLQIGFLAMCTAKVAGVEECEAGFLRAGWDGRLTYDMALLDGWALDAMGDRIRAVWEMQQGAACRMEMQVIMPPLSVGSHCTYCPARRSCPAQVQPVALALAGSIDELAAETLPSLDVLRELVGALVPDAKGRLIDRVDVAIEYLTMVRGIIRDDAKSDPVPLPNGNLLAEVTWGSSHPFVSPEAEAEMDALKARLTTEGKIKSKQVSQVREVTRKTYEKRRVIR